MNLGLQALKNKDIAYTF